MHNMIRITILSLAIFGILMVSAVPMQKNTAGKRLIKTSQSKPAEWLNEAAVQALIEKDQGFIDVTNVKEYNGEPITNHHTQGVPTTLRYQEVVTKAIQNISLTRIESFIQTFSDFHNRYLNLSTGVDSEKWLLSQINDSTQGYPGSISVIEFEHPDWLQNSIIARIEGADPVLRSEVVVLGAHQDSLNSQGQELRSPGADDNASGCIVLLEALRAVVAHGIIPNRTVEFHWYAAEERGLLGSREIARSYRDAQVNVIAMINYDVVGYYVAGNDDVAIITDYVDPALTEFLRLLVDGYLDFGRRERECGYACSDHATWTENGYPSARPTQAVRNGQMHTIYDTIETVSFVQVREFVKIAIGWLVELAEPVSGSTETFRN